MFSGRVDFGSVNKIANVRIIRVCEVMANAIENHASVPQHLDAGICQAERFDSILHRNSSRQALGLNERLRFYRYGPDQQFAAHVDGSFVRANGERSLLTFMVYLNDGFEGGETKFTETTIQPRKAMALIFRHELLHEGAAVTSGRKYVLRSDVMFGAVGYIRG